MRRLALGRRARTLGLAFLVLVDGVYATSGLDGRRAAAAGLTPSMSDPTSGPAMLVFLLGAGLTIAVGWRDRWPVALTFAGSAAALVAQLGPTVALVALIWVVAMRPWREVLGLAALVTAVTALAVWRDAVATPAATSFWGTILGSEDEPVAWFMPVVLTVLLIGAFAGVGLWLRTRAALRTAEVVVASEREAVTTLTDQVSRQAEREKLAREIHDGLGHNLSILSVHAGALEAMAESGEAPGTAAQIKESAHVVRETAARSVSELHSLLNILRNPDDPDVAAPTKTLRDVRSLIDDSVTAGMPLVATVYVEDGEAMDPPLAQAAYRIVQELLTNARKHAATVPVRLTVTGGRAEGSLVIGTANHLPPPTWPRPGDEGSRPGTGLAGIGERVEHYGGDMQWGADDEAVFRVSIRLPWRLSAVATGKGN
ncbi:histidine kinase [Intrasporangium sp. DVR]